MYFLRSQKHNYRYPILVLLGILDRVPGYNIMRYQCDVRQLLFGELMNPERCQMKVEKHLPLLASWSRYSFIPEDEVMIYDIIGV